MGSRPTIQLTPLHIVRREENMYMPKSTVGPIYVYIHSNLNIWYRLGNEFELTVIDEEGISAVSLRNLKILGHSVKCKVKDVFQVNDKIIILKLKLKEE
jgi:hypothetical protein